MTLPKANADCLGNIELAASKGGWDRKFAGVCASKCLELLEKAGTQQFDLAKFAHCSTVLAEHSRAVGHCSIVLGEHSRAVNEFWAAP